MKIIIEKKLGNNTYKFEIEKEKEINALAEAGSISSMPSVCGICKSKNVHLASNRAKGYVFVKVLCEDCNARAQMGQYKEGGGMFWKSWEKYEAPAKGSIPVIEEE